MPKVQRYSLFPGAVLLCIVTCIPRLLAQTAVLTRSYDDARTSANTQESVLTPASVQAKGLQRALRLPRAGDPRLPQTGLDDPRIEAQPVYVPHLTMSDGMAHDVIFVCTMGNSIYAFDARTGLTLAPYPISLGKPILPKLTPAPGFPGRTDIDLWGINIHWGILSTPVIDLDTQTLYVVNWCLTTQSPKGAFHLNALDLRTGQPRHPALTITATAPLGNPPATFDPTLQKQRSALLLVPLRQPSGAPVHKTLFMACGLTKETAAGHHGWLLAFDVDSFLQTAAWCSTPTSQGGGIWQAGQGPAADETGDIYFMTANGGFNGDTVTPATEFAESFVRLHYTPPSGGAGQLTVASWFTPFRDAGRGTLNGYDFTDQDLGSAGPILPPGTSLILGAGKDGVLYILDRANLGNAFANFTKLKQNPPSFVTYFPAGHSSTGNLDFFSDGKTHHLHGSPLVWNSPDLGPLVFVWGENECLRAWILNTAAGAVTFRAKSQEVASQGAAGLGGMPGGMLTLSANGSAPHTGILWATAPINGDANKFVVPGILRAYDATRLDTNNNVDGTPRLKLLWDSTRVPAPFLYDKFCPPVVADGRVLVATYDGHVDVYVLK